MRLWQRLLEHDGIAVYAGEQAVSYAELREQSQALAVQLWGPSPLANGRQLVLLQAPLPTSVSLYPMASEVYKEELAEVEALLRLIARFDLLLSGKVVEQ